MARIQQGFVKLQKLLQIEPFKIVGLWSNGETRLNDFSSEVEQWKNGTNKELKKLAILKVFKTAFIKNGTLAFAGSTVHIPGIVQDQPVDFDRRALYCDSQLIGKAVSYEDAIQHQKNRLNRHKRPASSPNGLQVSPHAKVLEMDSDLLTKMSQKIGSPVTPLIVIGDELVELEIKWIFSDL